MLLLAGCLERTRTGVFLIDEAEDRALTAERVPEGGDRMLADRMTGGVCVLDLDGAPPLDLFFAGRTSGTHLYRALPDGRYEDASALLDHEGVDASGCVAADLNGDRRDDLVVPGVGSVFLFTRTDAGFDREVLASGSSGALYTSASAGDLDADGDLDLVIAGFVDEDPIPEDCGSPLPCNLALFGVPPIPDLLLVREGDGWVERAAELAPDLSLAEPTLVTVIVDLNADGAPEILVGNDLGARYHDRLLVRRDGIFVDDALAHGLATNRRGYGIDTMGYAIGDVDGDGNLDVAASDFSGHATALFFCGSDGFCDDRGLDVGLLFTETTLRWGNALADLDLDGELDLFEACGHVYREDEAAILGVRLVQAQPPTLFFGVGGGHFARAIPEAGSGLATPRHGRGVAVFDADDDGRLDVVMATTQGRPALLRNAIEPAGHWLRVELHGRPPNTGGIGARLEVDDGTRTRIRARIAGEGYSGSFDPRLHVGLPAAGPVHVRVRWPSGLVTELDTDVDRAIVVSE